MKQFFTLIILAILFCGCEKEFSKEVPTNNNNSNATDTSVIVIKKTIYRYSGSTDTAYTIYKNNKINGIKGYIITDSIPYLNYLSTSRFKYDNSGHLTEINAVNNSPTNPTVIVKKITWFNNKIKKIYWTEDAAVRMDRTFDYTYSNDSLLIKYAIVSRASFLFDSVSVTMITDTAQNRVGVIYESGAYEFNLPGSSTKQTHYSQTNFLYSGNNISSVRHFGEIFDNSTPAPAYSHETDSSVNYFTRETQASAFMNNLEKDILGKELRVLAYNQADSVNWWFEDYFNYGNFNAVSSGKYYAIDNIFTAAYAPLKTSSISYIVRHDAVITDQKTNYLFKKLDYTLDVQNRIKLIKEYLVTTNALVTETHFFYP